MGSRRGNHGCARGYATCSAKSLILANSCKPLSLISRVPQVERSQILEFTQGLKSGVCDVRMASRRYSRSCAAACRSP